MQPHPREGGGNQRRGSPAVAQSGGQCSVGQRSTTKQGRTSGTCSIRAEQPTPDEPQPGAPQVRNHWALTSGTSHIWAQCGPACALKQGLATFSAVAR